MTIQDAINRADQLKPNMMSDSIKVAFLNQIDQMIWDEIITQHDLPLEEGQEPPERPEYDDETSGDTELLVQSPHDMLYVYWLISQIDHLNMEADKYNNDRQLFENAYEQYSDWYTRSYMPLQKVREFLL